MVPVLTAREITLKQLGEKFGLQSQYVLSRLFYILNPGNDLYQVLRVLKRIAQLAVSE